MAAPARSRWRRRCADTRLGLRRRRHPRARQPDRRGALLRRRRHCEILRCPDWEVLPYDVFSPHPDIVSERLQTLFELPEALTWRILILSRRHPPAAPAAGQLRAGPRLRRSAWGRRWRRALRPAPGEPATRAWARSRPGRIRGARLAASMCSRWARATPLRIDLFDAADRGHPALRPGDPALARALESRAAAAGARGAARCRGGRGFRRRYRTRFEGESTRPPSTAASARAWRRRASSSTCRCSSSSTATLVRLPAAAHA